MSKIFTPEELGLMKSDWRRNANLSDDERLRRVAELHACMPEDVAKALKLEVHKAKEARDVGFSVKKGRKGYDQAVRDQMVKAVLLDGMSHGEAADRYGVSKSSVTRWVGEAKEKQQEFLDYPDSEKEKLPCKQAAEKNLDAAPYLPEKSCLEAAASGGGQVESVPCAKAALENTHAPEVIASDCAKKSEELPQKTNEPPRPCTEPKSFDVSTMSRELATGTEGLQTFMDNFAGVDVFSEDELNLLDLILERANGFCSGFDAALEIFQGFGFDSKEQSLD